jgi:hypothetical protein
LPKGVFAPSKKVPKNSSCKKNWSTNGIRATNFSQTHIISQHPYTDFLRKNSCSRFKSHRHQTL